MDLINNKACIICCGIGGHYGVGVDRLERSLNFVGWGGHNILWKDYPEGCQPHIGSGQYNFKLHCFEEAFRRGYKVVLWLDASLYAVNDPMPVFDYVNDNGLYFFKSGYSLAETATDDLLTYGDVLREDLVNVSEFATGAVGINIDNPKGKQFFEGWKDTMQQGLFNGCRTYDPADSEHPLFKFSRQDQSAASMVLHKMGVTTAGEDLDMIAYYSTNFSPERIIFFIKGIN